MIAMASSPGASLQKASISATQPSPVCRLRLFAGSKQTVHFLFPFSTEGSHNSKYHQGPEWFKSKHSPDHRPLVRRRALEGKPPRSSLETREYTETWGLLLLSAGGLPPPLIHARIIFSVSLKKQICLLGQGSIDGSLIAMRSQMPPVTAN